MKKIILNILFIIFYFASNAQDIDYRVGVDSNDVNLGDAIQLTVYLKFPSEKYALIFPNINESFTTPFKILNQTNIDTTESSRFTILKQTTTIASYDTGMYMIPKLHVNGFRSDTSGNIDIAADSILIRVKNIPVNINGDIKDIIDVNKTESKWINIAKIIAGVLLISLLVFLLYKYLKSKKTVLPKAPINPYQYAISQLKSIENNTPTNNLESKNYYTVITDAIKYYIQNRYKISVLDKTSNETISILNANHQTKNCATILNEIFNTADLVKFAKMDAPQTKNKELLANAKTVIETLEKDWMAEQQKILENQKANG